MSRRMTMSPTLEEQELPWGGERRAGRRDEWQLVIAWSLDEPWRVGQSAIVREASVLGRGGPQTDDKLPRVVFHSRRPGAAEPGPSLAAPRVSRTQLPLVPGSGGKLDVTSIGKCTLLVDGVETERAEVGPGAVLQLKNSLVLYVLHEPPPEPL